MTGPGDHSVGAGLRFQLQGLTLCPARTHGPDRVTLNAAVT